MLNKKSVAKIFFLIFLSLLLILSVLLSSCSFGIPSNEKLLSTLNDYENKILILENELSHLKADHERLDSQKNAELEKLKTEILNLKDRIESAETNKPQEDESKSDSEFTYVPDGNEAVITGYVGKGTSLIIPSVIDGYTVSAIGDEAFKGLKITSVSIPSTVKSIGWFSFSDCISLTAAVIPDSVTSIGYEAFSGAKNLTVYASADSYAAKYAKSYGITVSLE